jgi:SulP family sulfate permease
MQVIGSAIMPRASARRPLAQRLAIILAVAVQIGVLLACVFFIMRMSALFRVQALAALPAQVLPAGVQAFELFGPLFFGAVGKVEALAQQVAPGTQVLVLDMHRMISLDTSGLDALEQLLRTLRRRHVRLMLANLNEQPLSLMQRAGFDAQLGAENIVASLGEVLAGLEAVKPCAKAGAAP